MKLKTNKAIRKRIRLTGGKKVQKIKVRTGGQNHFNARESGKVTKNKRRDRTMSSVNTKNIRTLTPYN